MAGYIILTNKDDYTTRLDTPGIEPVETYEYYFYSRRLAEFTIAKVLDEDTRTIIQDHEDTTKICDIPSRVFPSFEDIKDARKEINELANSNLDYVKLVKK